MIIVVEGKNDYNKIKSVFKDANVLITNGSAVALDFIEMLITLAEHHQIVLCLDPDYAGEKIRRTISEAIPSASHVFAQACCAKSKNGKKIGIEHMSGKDIRTLFTDIKTPAKVCNLNMQDMFDLGLAGGNNSSKLREKIGKKLNIGYANSKQFLYRLNMVNITKNQIKEYL